MHNNILGSVGGSEMLAILSQFNNDQAEELAAASKKYQIRIVIHLSENTQVKTQR